MIKLRYYTNIAPHYRKSLWELLLKDKDIDIDIFFGRSSKPHGIKEIVLTEDIFEQKKLRLHTLKNIRLFNILVFQIGTIRDAIINKPDAALFLGQAYVISTWLAALIYKLKDVKVFFWGHGLYGNESLIKKYFNIYFIKIADAFLVYNDYSKTILIKNKIDSSKIFVINNSLNYSFSIGFRNQYISLKKPENLPFFKSPDKYLLIYIGRLTPQKKLHLLIEVVSLLNKDKYKYNLLIIGEGPERNILEKYASDGVINEYIKFYGALYDEYKIGKYLSLADLCVSPGNVGLTAIHSLSYGTPVVTHNNFTSQMPEFEAIVEGETGFFFRENDYIDLAEKTEIWFSKMRNKNEIKRKCYKIIDEKYNPHYQISVIKNCLSQFKFI